MFYRFLAAVTLHNGSLVGWARAVPRGSALLGGRWQAATRSAQWEKFVAVDSRCPRRRHPPSIDRHRRRPRHNRAISPPLTFVTPRTDASAERHRFCILICPARDGGDTGWYKLPFPSCRGRARRPRRGADIGRILRAEDGCLWQFWCW